MVQCGAGGGAGAVGSNVKTMSDILIFGLWVALLALHPSPFDEGWAWWSLLSVGLVGLVLEILKCCSERK